MPTRSKLLGWIDRRQRLLLFGLLVALHLLLLEGVGSRLGQSLFLVQVGLFFLWQPFIRADRTVEPFNAFLVAILVVLATALLSWWLLAFWVALICGVLGGKVFLTGDRWGRLVHQLALAYLVIVLLAYLTPRFLPGTAGIGGNFDLLVRYGLPLIFLFMGVLPEEPSSQRMEVVDFAYSVFVFLMLTVLVLGSAAGMLLTGRDYVSSLLSTMLFSAGALLLLAWAWNPRAGFSGIASLFSRHLLSAGMPFEAWVEALAYRARSDEDAEALVAWACAELPDRFPWIAGGEWETDGEKNRFGGMAPVVTEFAYESLRIRVFTRSALTPALAWHMQMVTRLLAEFHLARVRARELRRLSYLEAIHETGSRLTHDVKNLLQSLNALCMAAASDADANSPAFQQLVRRQLPVIAQRLTQTLEKLKVPDALDTEIADALEWWAEMSARHSHEGIVFRTEGRLAGVSVPASLFANGIENLIRNATDKRGATPRLQVWATLAAEAHGPSLTVCDDGAPVPDALARDIGRNPVASENGLGVGLYQVGRYAAMRGYRLQLAENRPGRVCFRLFPV